MAILNLKSKPVYAKAVQFTGDNIEECIMVHGGFDSKDEFAIRKTSYTYTADRSVHECYVEYVTTDFSTQYFEFDIFCDWYVVKEDNHDAKIMPEKSLKYEYDETNDEQNILDKIKTSVSEIIEAELQKYEPRYCCDCTHYKTLLYFSENAQCTLHECLVNSEKSKACKDYYMREK